MAYNFQKYSWNYIQSLGEKYDLGSIMHYESHAFSSTRGRPTIIPKNRNAGTRMGQRNGFSQIDIRKINKLYQCQISSSGAEVQSKVGLKKTSNEITSE